MVDNVNITEGAGTVVAADDIAGVKHQRVKMSLGADGAATDALGGAGAVAAGVQRVTLASDDPAVALLTILGGYLDGVEGKLDTLHTDLATTLAGLVDGLEGILGTTAGAAVITDANGTVQQYLRGLVKQWIAGTLVVGPGTSLIGKVKTKFIETAAVVMTRPANQTPYAANDAVSDNATAGSVTPISLTFSDVINDTVTVERLRIKTTDSGVQGKSFRIWLFNAAPSITGGDNAAFSVAATGLIGTMSGSFRATSDGAFGVFVPDEGSRIIAKPFSGDVVIKGLMQTLDIVTSSANSTTFTVTGEGFQGAA